MTEDQRTIGRLEAHVDDLRTEVRGMREDINGLKALVEQGKGAKAVLLFLAGLVGSSLTFAGAWAAGLLRGH